MIQPIKHVCLHSASTRDRESLKKKIHLNEITFLDNVYYMIKNILKFSSTFFAGLKANHQF